jgi:hypothetical protein
MYLAMGVFTLILMVSNRATEGWSWGLLVAIYLPYVIVSLWHLVGACGEFAWSLDAEINEGARKILRDNVTAIIFLIFLFGLARRYIPVGDFKLVMEKTKSVLLGLALVYTWLGVIRAVLATCWKKVGGDADAESRVGAGQAHGCASVTCEPALRNGSDGGGVAAAAASQGGGQSGEVRTSVAEQVDDKNGRGWQMLAIGVVIGVLANGVVVRRLRRN